MLAPVLRYHVAKCAVRCPPLLLIPSPRWLLRASCSSVRETHLTRRFAPGRPFSCALRCPYSDRALGHCPNAKAGPAPARTDFAAPERQIHWRIRPNLSTTDPESPAASALALPLTIAQDKDTVTGGGLHMFEPPGRDRKQGNHRDGMPDGKEEKTEPPPPCAGA